MNTFISFLKELIKSVVNFFRGSSQKEIKEIEFMPYEPLTPEKAQQIKEQLPPEPTQVDPKPTQKKDYLTLLFNGMRDFEGGPNDLNYKNNNPLNARCSSQGYLPKYGNVQCVNRFAVFPTWELGSEYGRNLILTKARRHPEWNLVNFIGHPTEGWAPASDNNEPIGYASFLGRKLNVNPYTFTLKNLLT